jgi:hypothetical protein
MIMACLRENRALQALGLDREHRLSKRIFPRLVVSQQTLEGLGQASYSGNLA